MTGINDFGSVYFYAELNILTIGTLYQPDSLNLVWLVEM
jgi:hypothetical protein